MQHDLFPNPNPRTRAGFPLIVVVEADVIDGPERIVAPLTLRSRTIARRPNRALPQVRHGEQEFLVMLPLPGTVSRATLRKSVGSLKSYRDDLTRAPDWLFFGI